MRKQERKRHNIAIVSYHSTVYITNRPLIPLSYIVSNTATITQSCCS